MPATRPEREEARLRWGRLALATHARTSPHMPGSSLARISGSDQAETEVDPLPSTTPSRDENQPYRVSVEADLEGTSCVYHTLAAAHTIGHRRTRTPKALAAPPKEQHPNPADWPGVTDDETAKGLSGRANGARGQINL
ncbi:hypothetical protein PC9H_005671 [Pleurotus ostreatus]|uniref:Uncharacterized protein n=1 Tax=Pleurotus ostreatus TaxID=5322 RepID=A0A8H7A0W3_PLEOS|nr:uncharacterized protein PC9H_005671 [Pleurotus ostreatus]KAF7433708.1 hypothetical protein PC9H_005671 [Pleurotus ostreatus]